MKVTFFDQLINCPKRGGGQLAGAASTDDRAPRASLNGDVPADDGELLRRARGATNGAKFAALYDRGDSRGQGYGSPSEADLALGDLLCADLHTIADARDDDALLEKIAEAPTTLLLLRALAARREALGLSQTQVAARMGTSQSSVARLEAGEADARLSTVERFAAALGARLHWSLDGAPSH